MKRAGRAMASSSAFRDMQRDLEAKANELSKLQKGNSWDIRFYILGLRMIAILMLWSD